MIFSRLYLCSIIVTVLLISCENTGTPIAKLISEDMASVWIKSISNLAEKCCGEGTVSTTLSNNLTKVEVSGWRQRTLEFISKRDLEVIGEIEIIEIYNPETVHGSLYRALIQIDKSRIYATRIVGINGLPSESKRDEIYFIENPSPNKQCCELLNNTEISDVGLKIYSYFKISNDSLLLKSTFLL